MEIKTKYNLGDIVYTMFQNKVVNFTIEKIDIRANDKEISVVYTSKTGDNERHNYVISEGKVFATREELLKSL